MLYMNTEMGIWLSKELEKRGWTYRETGRRAGISHVTISNIISGQQNPGLDFCTGIAKALGMPPETVMRKAGLIPPHPDDNMGAGEFIAEVSEMLRGLSLEDREFIYEMVKLQYQRANEKHKNHESNTTLSPDPV